MSDLSKLFCVSLSIGEGDAASLREKAAFSEEEVSAQLKEILRLSSFSSENSQPALLYLKTCHRVEIFGFDVDDQIVVAQWLAKRQISLSPDRILRDRDVLVHAIAVSSGMQSEVLGETQISGQMKDAVEWSRGAGILSGPLDRCFQQVLRVTKRIRSETPLGAGLVSLAHVAIDGLFEVFDSLENKSALIVGVGTMAQQSLARLEARNIGKVTWINRHPENIPVASLSPKVQQADFSRLSELVWEHSIVVMATASQECLLDYASLLKAKGGVKAVTNPRGLLDYGMPRNVDPKIHGKEGFYVQNVDEFRDRAERNSESRKAALALAQQILNEELVSLVRVWNAWGKGPLMAELFKNMESLCTLAESLQVEVAQKPEMRYTFRNIYAKLMHRLVEVLEGVEEPLSSQILETLASAWRQPEEWLLRKQRSPPRAAKARPRDP